MPKPVQPAAHALLGMDLDALTALMAKLEQPAYRAKQLFHALYRDRVTSIDEISTFPKPLRDQLNAVGYTLTLPKLDKRFKSTDGTVRYLFSFSDGQSVETVWMPEGDGVEDVETDKSQIAAKTAGKKPPIKSKHGLPFGRTRATICISSQVGCAVGCKFCLTAMLGLQRNLTAGEIIGQVLTVLNDHKVNVNSERINLVFMGQGEPFHNYDQFIAAVRLLVSGVKLAESRMTVSTSGIVPRITDLGNEPVRPKLAISLNASNDEVRSRIMPINRKWDIADIIAAARAYPLRRKEYVTFEYVLLGGTTDQPEQAQELIKLLAPMRDRCKVNLIAWNPGPVVPFSTPEQKFVLAFQKILMDAGIPTYIRRPRGRDIYAACGQLKRTVA